MTEDERGAAAVEYAILAGLIVLAIVASLTAISSTISDNFQFISDTLLSAVSG
ncbi:Flp/Fap pilin component [Pseudovibrio sp. FO-BEG1]|nr:Flp/Fap pilin component [Pseudovibrio sp. FO-BEG1]